MQTKKKKKHLAAEMIPSAVHERTQTLLVGVRDKETPASTSGTCNFTSVS